MARNPRLARGPVPEGAPRRSAARLVLMVVLVVAAFVVLAVAVGGVGR